MSYLKLVAMGQRLQRMINQLLIAIFGLTSIYFAMGKNPTMRKYAPIIGLAGQPFWGYFAYQSKGWGIGLLVMAYTLVYINGIRVQWAQNTPYSAMREIELERDYWKAQAESLARAVMHDMTAQTN